MVKAPPWAGTAMTYARLGKTLGEEETAREDGGLSQELPLRVTVRGDMNRGEAQLPRLTAWTPPLRVSARR